DQALHRQNAVEDGRNQMPLTEDEMNRLADLVTQRVLAALGQPPPGSQASATSAPPSPNQAVSPGAYPMAAPGAYPMAAPGAYPISAPGESPGSAAPAQYPIAAPGQNPGITGPAYRGPRPGLQGPAADPARPNTGSGAYPDYP